MRPGRILLIIVALAAASSPAAGETRFGPGSLTVLPEDGRDVYLQAFASARREIRIEICVLEDPAVLTGLRDALGRGVRVRVLVDGGKYRSVARERSNLARFVTAAGGSVRVSNPVFPRSFPKVILIDSSRAVVGSACLDSTTFARYRDYAYVTGSGRLIADLSRLFENDWRFSRPPGVRPPALVPTPATTSPGLLVSPVTATGRLVAFVRGARRGLDVTSELLGNPTLEAELVAAAARGVRVRLISPLQVNGATPAAQRRQTGSLALLRAAGVRVNVTRRPESAARPYMHARTMVADGARAYLGSISLSPDSTTVNREVGLILTRRAVVERMARRFAADFAARSTPYVPGAAR
jgi:phosphatidylserine/phosphatidylglycerophosphate/cardiolipin synthase-like enzyme